MGRFLELPSWHQEIHEENLPIAAGLKESWSEAEHFSVGINQDDQVVPGRCHCQRLVQGAELHEMMSFHETSKRCRTYCWWFRNLFKNHLGCEKPNVNNDINYQPQLVNAGFQPPTVVISSRYIQLKCWTPVVNYFDASVIPEIWGLMRIRLWGFTVNDDTKKDSAGLLSRKDTKTTKVCQMKSKEFPLKHMVRT